MFKTEEALMKIALADPCWRNLKLWSWARDYEAQMNEWNDIWPPVTDDRRLFINTYSQVYQALASMQKYPDNYICCAVNRSLENDRDMMNRIIKRFKEEVRK